jgi:hypothetical protein
MLVSAEAMGVKSVLNDDNYMIAFPLLSIAYAELQREHGAEAEAAAREALSRFLRASPVVWSTPRTT